MASIAQFSANRLNALSSTGPRTDSGKQASSRNAVRHGLYASVDSLCGTDRAQFDEIYQYFAELHPQPEAQQFRHELALAWFRRERVRTMEAAFFNLQMDLFRENVPGADRDRLLVGILMADAEHKSLLARLHRWDRAFSRDIERAQKALKEMAQPTDPEPPIAPPTEIAETNPIPAPSPAPQSLNSPCRCGSGLKYKRCCGILARNNIALQGVCGSASQPADR